jgi:hypothetical protein
MASQSVSRVIRHLPHILATFSIGLLALPCCAIDNDVAFFEERIRPLFHRYCTECHNDDDPQGGLSLESAEGWMDRDVINIENPNTSRLLKAVKQEDKELVMPPAESGKRLSNREIEDLEHWIRAGARDPRSKREAPLGPKRRAKTFTITEHDLAHWAYQPIVRDPPSLHEANDTALHPIDKRIQFQLQRLGIASNPRASPRELVRRATFDLWGLPPTYDDVLAFEQQPTEEAWDKLIDRLLDSPHYGERWGRHWLDVVRYAETNGYERDGPKPNAWRYRDYVIRSFNQDKPYDRFLTEQLAGDWLIEQDPVYGTPESEPWKEAIIATGYFRLHIWDDEPDDTEAAELDDLDDIVATTSISMLGLTIGCARCHDHKFDPISQQDYYAILDLLRDIDPYGLSKKGGGGRGTGKIERFLVEQSKVDAWNATNVEKTAAPFETALSIQPPAQRKPTHVLHRGDYANPRQLVSPAIPVLFSSVSGAKEQGDLVPVLRHRLDFARWITHPSHPLTARVIANRIWQKHFGEGIAQTTDDFGYTGLAPANRELLDWLASELIQNGWSIKSLHRTIMRSEAYRASSSRQKTAASEADPDNRWFWRQNLRRLDAEAIRDSMLVYANALNDKRNGPSVFPSLSDEIKSTANPVSIHNWVASPESDQNCRSVFLAVKRSLKDPLLESFDFVNSHSPVGIRTVTTTGPQALMLLNDRFVTSHAEGLLRRVEPEPSTERRLIKLWQIVFQREPTSNELSGAESYLTQLDDARGAWVSLCRALLNSSEAIYVD